MVDNDPLKLTNSLLMQLKNNPEMMTYNFLNIKNQINVVMNNKRINIMIMISNIY